MSQSSAVRAVIFVGPGKKSQGGIAAVIENYKKTEFWKENNCVHFESTIDHRSILVKTLHDSLRLCKFPWTLLVRRTLAVSIHTSHSGSFYRKFFYLLISRILGLPVVLHIHPAAFARFYYHGGKLRKKFILIAGRLCDQIVCLSEEVRSELAAVFSPSKLRVLGNPVDIQHYSREGGTDHTRRPRVLFLGWIIQQKGVYDLVEAIPEVAKVVPDVMFVFAGNKEVEKLRGMVSSRRLEKFADVVGWVDGQAKLELLQSSKVLVLPSYTEGVPNVILEAMASKLPIVTTPVGGIPSVLAHNETAIFIEPGNQKSIVNGLLALLTDDQKCKTLADAAYERACELYSIDAIGSEVAQIYDRYNN